MSSLPSKWVYSDGARIPTAAPRSRSVQWSVRRARRAPRRPRGSAHGCQRGARRGGRSARHFPKDVRKANDVRLPQGRTRVKVPAERPTGSRPWRGSSSPCGRHGASPTRWPHCPDPTSTACAGSRATTSTWTLRFLGDADAGAVITRLRAAGDDRATAATGAAMAMLGRRVVVVPVAGLDTLALQSSRRRVIWASRRTGRSSATSRSPGAETTERADGSVDPRPSWPSGPRRGGRQQPHAPRRGALQDRCRRADRVSPDRR